MMIRKISISNGNRRSDNPTIPFTKVIEQAWMAPKPSHQNWHSMGTVESAYNGSAV